MPSGLVQSVSSSHRQRRTHILRFNQITVLGCVDRKQLHRILHFAELSSAKEVYLASKTNDSTTEKLPQPITNCRSCVLLPEIFGAALLDCRGPDEPSLELSCPLSSSLEFVRKLLFGRALDHCLFHLSPSSTNLRMATVSRSACYVHFIGISLAQPDPVEVHFQPVV